MKCIQKDVYKHVFFVVLFWSFLLTSFLAEIPWNAATIKYRFLFNQVSIAAHRNNGSWNSTRVCKSHLFFFFICVHAVFIAIDRLTHSKMWKGTNAKSDKAIHKHIYRQVACALVFSIFGFRLGRGAFGFAFFEESRMTTHTAPTPRFDFPPKEFGRVFFSPRSRWPVCCGEGVRTQQSPYDIVERPEKFGLRHKMKKTRFWHDATFSKGKNVNFDPFHSHFWTSQKPIKTHRFWSFSH